MYITYNSFLFCFAPSCDGALFCLFVRVRFCAVWLRAFLPHFRAPKVVGDLKKLIFGESPPIKALTGEQGICCGAACSPLACLGIDGLILKRNFYSAQLENGGKPLYKVGPEQDFNDVARQKRQHAPEQGGPEGGARRYHVPSRAESIANPAARRHRKTQPYISRAARCEKAGERRRKYVSDYEPARGPREVADAAPEGREHRQARRPEGDIYRKRNRRGDGAEQAACDHDREGGEVYDNRRESEGDGDLREYRADGRHKRARAQGFKVELFH